MRFSDKIKIIQGDHDLYQVSISTTYLAQSKKHFVTFGYLADFSFKSFGNSSLLPLKWYESVGLIVDYLQN